MELDPGATSNFIDAVRDKPALWNKASKEFKEGKKKPQMWADLAKDYDFEDGEAAKKRWQYLRDYYLKQKNKRAASGSAADDEAVTWAFYAQLSFLDVTLESRKGRVSSRATQPFAGPSSQFDLFPDDDDDDDSLNSSTKDENRPVGEPTPKRIKQERLSLEKRFLGVMESTANQIQAASSVEETAEELFAKSIGKKLTELKAINPAGVEWAMLEIQRVMYQVKCPQPQVAGVDQFNYVTGQGL